MQKERSSFSNQIGFVLAAAGSAVGLGNIWRFPYLAAKYGGGTFLVTYIILAVTFGFALMVTEIAIGRKTGLSCISAYRSLDKRFAFLGWIAALVPIIITPYYCVIGGWVTKYLVEFLIDGGQAAAQDSFFGSFIGMTEQGLGSGPVFWFLLFILFTGLIVLFGVQKGIERVSRTMMPILVVLTIFIAGYSLTIPGAMAGLKFYLLPDFSNFSMTTVLGALGQLFYSMSLAMGIMITYGSYMKKEDNLERSVAQIEVFDTGIALLAGLMVVPAVVAFNGGDPNAINAGPSLMFGTMPKVFAFMGSFGGIVGTAFFLLVLLAALTSSISLMETVVSMVQDRLHWHRKPTTVIVTLCLTALGLPSALGFGLWSSVTVLGLQFLDFFDFISNSVLMPIVAFLTCILIGHVVGTRVIVEEVEHSQTPFGRKKLYTLMIRWVAPILLVTILGTEVAKYLGLIKI